MQLIVGVILLSLPFFSNISFSKPSINVAVDNGCNNTTTACNYHGLGMTDWWVGLNGPSGSEKWVKSNIFRVELLFCFMRGNGNITYVFQFMSQLRDNSTHSERTQLLKLRRILSQWSCIYRNCVFKNSWNQICTNVCALPMIVPISFTSFKNEFGEGQT